MRGGPVDAADAGRSASPPTAAQPPDDEPVGGLCLGSERDGLPARGRGRCDRLWTIPLRRAGPESLNVAAAAAIAIGRISSAA